MRKVITASLALVAGIAAACPVASAQPAAQAVLVAGDGSLRVFDNAVQRIAGWLSDRAGVAPQWIARLSGASDAIAQDGVQSATLEHVVQAIEQLRPVAGQTCFVFVTSHGMHRRGVLLAYQEEVLTPAVLDRALTAGCADAPTVAIVSACYSGAFARRPMARRNRIILTAARSDRPSFGCDADETYTFFDQCLLASLDHGPGWRDVFRATRQCVARREREEDDLPSEPQAWFGGDVAQLALPSRGH